MKTQKRLRKQIHACCMNRNYDSLTQHSQHQDKWQKWRKDVLRHTHHDHTDVSPDEKRESNIKERKSVISIFLLADLVF